VIIGGNFLQGAKGQIDASITEGPCKFLENAVSKGGEKVLAVARWAEWSEKALRAMARNRWSWHGCLGQR